MTGVLGNLFKKKEEEEDFLAYDKGMGGAGVPGPAGGLGAPGGELGLPTTPALPSAESQMVQKDIELLTSKLDALKVSMDTILQRLANIEARLSQQRQAPQQPQQPSGFGFGEQQPQQQQQDTGWHF